MMVMWVGSHFDVVQSRISKALRMSTTPEGAMRKMPIKSRVSVMPFDFLKTERPTALSGKRLDLTPQKIFLRLLPLIAIVPEEQRRRCRSSRGQGGVGRDGMGLGAEKMSELPLPLPHRYCSPAPPPIL